MNDELRNLEAEAKKDWPVIMSWVGGITALIGLAASLGGGLTWFTTHHRATAERKAKMALAQTQLEQSEYQTATESYNAILKEAPDDREALDAQLDAAMLWTENYHVSTTNEDELAALARPGLDEIMPILEAGLARSQGSRAADVRAHLGWAHLLNRRLAEREFGPEAERDIRDALAADPKNVYANAMLGSWILMNEGDLGEAVGHFNLAVSTGRARPFVRRLQMGGLAYHQKKGWRSAQMIAANDMRKDNESLDVDMRRSILSSCCDPDVASHDELTEALSAVSPDDEWKTYLWLDQEPRNAEIRQMDHEFIAASLLEIRGDRVDALAKFQALRQELKDSSGTVKDAVNASVTRLGGK